MERLRALASSGSLVDALGNAVTAEQLWGKRRHGPESLSDASRDGSDDSLGAPGRSPPCAAPLLHVDRIESPLHLTVVLCLGAAGLMHG